MRFRTLAIGLLWLALPLQADARDKPSIAAVLNSSDFSSAEDVIFSPNRQIVAIPAAESRATRVGLWSIESGLPLRALEYDAFFTAESLENLSEALVRDANGTGVSRGVLAEYPACQEKVMMRSGRKGLE